MCLFSFHDLLDTILFKQRLYPRRRKLWCQNGNVCFGRFCWSKFFFFYFLFFYFFIFIFLIFFFDGKQVCTIYSLLLPPLIRLTNIHVCYFFSQLLATLCYVAFLFFDKPVYAFILTALVGVNYTTFNSIPFALVTSAADPRDAGLFMGVLNSGSGTISIFYFLFYFFYFFIILLFFYYFFFISFILLSKKLLLKLLLILLLVKLLLGKIKMFNGELL